MISAGLSRCSSSLGKRTCITVMSASKLELNHIQLEFYRTVHSSASQRVARGSGDHSNNSLRVSPALVESFHQNVNWFNSHYEKVFGIAEIREMQARVLEVESEFVEVTQKRKICQDKIEHFKDEIKGIRDKLELTPRQSDNYLKLITQEHNLLREQLAIEVQLTQFKEREQLLLDNLSKLLRQSHELERLRQERAKYWQIISIALSLAGSLVAIIAQRIRNQKSVINHLVEFDTRLSELEVTLKSIKSDNDKQNELSLNELGRMNASLQEINSRLADSKTDTASEKKQARFGWIPHIPGFSYLKSWFRYDLF